MSLKERIQLLPTDLQILIGEYNIEHRRQTQQIKQEYFTMIYSFCRVCNSIFDKEICPTDYFIIRKYKLTCHWCSMDCFQLDTDNEVKIQCLSAIDDYYGRKT
jgi:hypothetical protein